MSFTQQRVASNTEMGRRLISPSGKSRNQLSDTKAHRMVTSTPAEIANYNRQVDHMKKMKKQSAARKKLESAGSL